MVIPCTAGAILFLRPAIGVVIAMAGTQAAIMSRIATYVPQMRVPLIVEGAMRACTSQMVLRTRAAAPMAIAT